MILRNNIDLKLSFINTKFFNSVNVFSHENKIVIRRVKYDFIFIIIFLSFVYK